jgi:hypothetical protein
MEGIGLREAGNFVGESCCAGKIVVSRTGEAYDALAKGPNRKIQICGGREGGVSRCEIGLR